MEAVHLLGGFVAGLLIGGWVVGYKFASNAREPMCLEWNGKLYKVYDVSKLDWHIDPEGYSISAKLDGQRYGVRNGRASND